MSETALISVIIPAYNAEDFIREAIASIRMQAYAPLEIIIVDDGSTDHTAQVVQNLGADIRYVYQPNQGPAAARNYGLTLAQGELVAFLDADDLWPADKLAQQVACLSVADEIQVVWGTTQILAYAGTPNPLLACLPAPRLTPCLGSLLCRSAVFQKVGLFEPALRLGEDIDWFKRLHETGIPVQRSAEVALIYHLRPGSMTYGKPLHELGWLQIIRRSLERQQAAGGRA